MRKHIERAIDNNLSSLSVTGTLHQRILNDIQGGTPVKKKMSLALVIALSLLLITAVALAAVILGGKDVVEQVIAPMAVKTDTDRFTKEEVEEILELAKKHGITLDPHFESRVRAEGSYFKDELAMLFAKDQLGGQPGTWDVEDQHWLARLWHQMNPELPIYAALPEEGELSQQEIEQAAAQYIKQQTGQDEDLFNLEAYRIYRSFRQIRQNPYHVIREWSVSFDPRKPDLPMFRLSLTPQGEVTDYWTDLRTLLHGTKEEKARLLTGRFHNIHGNIYGSQDAWAQETWQDLKDRLNALGLQQSELREIKYILQQNYTPPESAITKEEAIRIAAQAVSTHFKVDNDSLLDTSVGKFAPETKVFAIYLASGGQQRYKVSFEYDYLVEVDAITGDVLITDVYSPGNDFFRRYALDSLIPADKRAYATPRPTPMSDEEMFEKAQNTEFFPVNEELAPAWFFEKLQAIGYNGNTATGIFNMLYSQYGDDSRYWPILYQAMYEVKEHRPEPGTTFAGLPADSDMQQEEAVQLAFTSARQIPGSHLTDADWEQLKPIISFYFNLYGEGSRTWQIDLTDFQENHHGTQVAAVRIDAITGKVRSASLTREREETPVRDEDAWSTMGADGRPVVWRHKNAPDSFWELMEAKYNDRETVEKALKKWAEEYGEREGFWPPEPAAVVALWRYHDTESFGEEYVPSFEGIPGPDDLTQERAEEIAWQAVKEAAGDKYTQADYDSVRLKFIFRYDQRGSDGTLWWIEFSDERLNYNTSLADIMLDGKTGEILEINTDVGNG